MKKNISIVASLALCLALGGITDASATSIVDERFPEYNILPIVIHPNDNGVQFVLNNRAISGHIKAFTTFVSDADYSLSDLKANYPALPAGITSPVVSADLKKSDNLILDAEIPLSITTIMASEASNTLYYAFELWDGAIEVQRIDYQNCIDEAGGKYAGLECRLSGSSGDLVYKAYVDGVEIVPEPSNSAQTPIDTVGSDSASDGTQSQSAANSDPSNIVGDATKDSYPDDGGKTVASSARNTQNAANSNSSYKNVENTNYDTNSAILGAASAAGSSDVLPPASTPANPEAPTASSSARGSYSYEWWALLPFIFLLATVTIYFFVGFIKKRRNKEQKRIARSGL